MRERNLFNTVLRPGYDGPALGGLPDCLLPSLPNDLCCGHPGKLVFSSVMKSSKDVCLGQQNMSHSHAASIPIPAFSLFEFVPSDFLPFSFVFRLLYLCFSKIYTRQVKPSLLFIYLGSCFCFIKTFWVSITLSTISGFLVSLGQSISQIMTDPISSYHLAY
jgi:hypothetical protein